MGAAQAPASPDSSSEGDSDTDESHRHHRREARTTAPDEKPVDRQHVPRRSNSSVSSASALSTERSSQSYLEPSRPGPLCPCCSSGMVVGRKEVVLSDRERRRRPAPRREEDGSSGEDAHDRDKARSGRRQEHSRATANGKGSKRECNDLSRNGAAVARDTAMGSSSLPKAPTAASLAALANGPRSGGEAFGPTTSLLEDDDDVRSVRSGFSVNTAVVASHSRGGGSASARPGDAASMKAALKAFVQDMVKGRELHVPGPGQELRPVTCGLTKEVDAIIIMDAGSRRKAFMKDILQVHHGLEAMPLDTGIECLNSSVVVLELQGGDYVALHAGHARAAEDLVLYMRLLTAIQRQQARKPGSGANSVNGGATSVPFDNDDARSECSVQTGIVQQQLATGPVASASNDPKEAKRMFKMFTETMRRGRDFYVVKADGSLYDVECSLTKGHDEFRMRWDGQMRRVLLKDLNGVHTCNEVGKLGLGFPVDERCATMELQTGECITFKFGHVEACERFILCMRILVEQKRPRFATRGFDASAGRSGGGSSAEMFETSRSSHGHGGGAVGASVPTPADANAEDPKVAVELFVKQMVAGCELGVVGPGGITHVRCSMEPDLQEMKMTAPDGSCRGIPLAQVKTVHVGSEAAQLGLAGVSVDDLCATVELQSGDCVTFRLPSNEERNRFALCIRVFASAHQQG